MSLVGATNAEKIWNYCKSKGMNDCGCAGVLSSLDCESALNPKNLEDNYKYASGYTNESYTAAVDNGSYTKFATDGFGYGLAQWTWWTRKQGLLAYAKGRCVSSGIGSGGFECNAAKVRMPARRWIIRTKSPGFLRTAVL